MKIQSYFLLFFSLSGGLLACEFGADRINYKGIFDASIYDQSQALQDWEKVKTQLNAENLRSQILRDALRNKKKQKILAHFRRKIEESEAYRNELQKRPVDWSKIPNELGKGFVSGAVGWFSYRSSVAVGEALDRLIVSNKDGVLEKNNELNRQIENATEAQKKLENNINDELVSPFEDEFILQREAIKQNAPDLCREIETMLIRARNEESDLGEKLDFIRAALDLPTAHKILNLKESIAAFKSNKHFSALDNDVKTALVEIIYKLCTDSETDSTSSTKLRTTCFFYGPPGSGKTSAALELATMLGLPHFAITIHDPSQLSTDIVKGSRGWQPCLGWLSEALMARTADGKRYTNGILVLNDYDRVLLSEPEGQPNPSALSFLLENLDTDLKAFFSGYFKAHVSIRRLNIIITSNSALPKNTTLDRAGSSYQGISKNPYLALISRIGADTIHFSGFKENDLKVFLHSFIDELIKKYKITVINVEEYKSELFGSALSLQKEGSIEDNIELRLLKGQLERLIIAKAVDNLDQ